MLIKMRLLESVFASKTRIGILRKLCLQKDWQFTVSELARDIGTDKSLVSKAILQLEGENAVKVMTKGRSKLCQINSSNAVVRDVLMPVFDNEKEAETRIIKRFIEAFNPGRFKSIDSILVYGSFASGNFRLCSDIDLMILTKNDGEQSGIRSALEGVLDEFSKNDDLLFFADVVTVSEFRKMHGLNEPLFVEISKNCRKIYGGLNAVKSSREGVELMANETGGA